MGWKIKLKKAATEIATQTLVGIDENKDGVITLDEIADYAIAKAAKKLNTEPSIAKEYIMLFGTIILGFIALIKPEWSWDEDAQASWYLIMAFALLSTNIIYGGFLKSNFQKVFNKKEMAFEEVKATLEANKEALNKASSQISRLEYEIVVKDKEITFWKDLYEKATKKKDTYSSD